MQKKWTSSEYISLGGISVRVSEEYMDNLRDACI